jgi:acetylornithine deacetylase
MEREPRLVSALEEQVVARVREGRDELVGILADLIAFDTTARLPGDPARDETACQEYLRDLLAPADGGASQCEADLWEPEPVGLQHPLLPHGLDFAGRPQLAVRLRGEGGGRSLLLNGHIDAVSAEPLAKWTSDPFKAEIRDGQLYGRGSCDMKGGIADSLFALLVLRRLGVRLAGDVVFCTNTDEESSGAGSYSCVERGVKADAGLCAEPTEFDAWIACRGAVNATITIEGRTGHAEMVHPGWREGGAVNAIEKLCIVLGGLRHVRDDWRARGDYTHPLLSPGDIVPTVVKGGEWMVTYPSSCELTLDLQYLPAQVDAEGTGHAVFREVERYVNAAAASDPWLAEHPLRWDWPGDIVPAEVPADAPIVLAALRAGADVGHPGEIKGLDSWHDAAMYTRRAGTPTISFGPGGFRTAHTIDECVPVDDLVDHAAAVALAVMRWCGVAGQA